MLLGRNDLWPFHCHFISTAGVFRIELGDDHYLTGRFILGASRFQVLDRIKQKFALYVSIAGAPGKSMLNALSSSMTAFYRLPRKDSFRNEPTWASFASLPLTFDFVSPISLLPLILHGIQEAIDSSPNL